MEFIFGGLIVVISLLALVRILKKAKNGETLEVEPVGVFRDLPETVTGLGKIEEKTWERK